MAENIENEQVKNPASESENVQAEEQVQVDAQAENEEQQPQEQEQQQPQEQEQPCMYDFKDGDFITDGEEEIGIYESQSENYLHLHMKADICNGKINWLTVDTVARKDKAWRKTTELENQFFAALVCNVCKTVCNR